MSNPAAKQPWGSVPSRMSLQLPSELSFTVTVQIGPDRPHRSSNPVQQSSYLVDFGIVTFATLPVVEDTHCSIITNFPWTPSMGKSPVVCFNNHRCSACCSSCPQHRTRGNGIPRNVCTHSFPSAQITNVDFAGPLAHVESGGGL